MVCVHYTLRILIRTIRYLSTSLFSLYIIQYKEYAQAYAILKLWMFTQQHEILIQLELFGTLDSKYCKILLLYTNNFYIQVFISIMPIFRSLCIFHAIIDFYYHTLYSMFIFLFYWGHNIIHWSVFYVLFGFFRFTQYRC